MSGGWPGVAVAAVVVAVLAVDNVRTLRLRDVLTLGGLAGTLAVTAACSLVSGDGRALVGSLGGAAALFAVLFLAEFTRPGTLGFGTVKASALVGAAAGGLGSAPWLGALVGLAAGCAVLMLLSWRLASADLPTGPALAAGLAASVGVALVAA